MDHPPRTSAASPRTTVSPGELTSALSLARQADHPPAELSAADRRVVLAGGCVTRLDKQAVTAICVVASPRDGVWRSVHDPAVLADPSVTEVRLSFTADGTEVWYGRLRLPPPLADRHWVIRSWLHTALHDATGGRAWERVWVESGDASAAREAVANGSLDPGVAGDLDEAVVTPCNRGAWLAIAMGEDHTLLAYRAEVHLGGSVPGWIVRETTKRQVSALLGRVAQAAGLPHPPTVAGDGRSVSDG